MLTWEKTEYGFRFTLAGVITEKEISDWLEAIKESIKKSGGNFHVFVNMRELEILPVNCKETMFEAQTFCKDNGMLRSVVILDDKITAMQFRLIAKKTGIYKWERYIDAAINPNWEQKGMDWLIYAKDPEEELTEINTRSADSYDNSL